MIRRKVGNDENSFIINYSKALILKKYLKLSKV